MKTKELKVSIKVNVQRSVLDSTDEPYFYRLGFEKEEEVLKTEVDKGIEAWFEGFEILSNERMTSEFRQQEDGEQLVTARLYYNVLVEVS